MESAPEPSRDQSSRETEVDLQASTSASDVVYEAELAEPKATAPAPSRPARRRRLIPLVLFVLTCFSTFFVGATHWGASLHTQVLDTEIWSLMPYRRAILEHWNDGLVYMGCVLAILLTHEMGHFIATVRYRIPASYPYFLPLPFTPIGTLGAVIGMDGMRADRKEMFDIGIAGPLAGLVVAIPIMWIGVEQLDFTQKAMGPYSLDLPLAVRWQLDQIQPAGYTPGAAILHSQLNPWFMAGWFGFIVTALNMMPVSQLDGGHVTYALFGKRAHWIARLFMLFAIGYMIAAGVYGLWLMLLLVLLVGTDHPPTRDDNARLGWFRIGLGIASLSIPLVCFAPRVVIPHFALVVLFCLVRRMPR